MMITFTIILITLTACATPQIEAVLPNPASVFCEQNGNKLEVRTTPDGSQSGRCVFSDVSTEESAPGSHMPPGATEQVVGWWGVIRSTESGAQYDDYFERQDLGQIIYFGIDSMDPAVKSQIEVLRDSGKIVHIYGTLVSNVPDYNGSQILVDRIEREN